MRALDRKLLRDLGRIRMQALAIALVLACGVMVQVMASGTLRSLTETQAAYYDRHRFADVFARATRAPAHLVGAVSALDGVAQAEARIVLPAVLDLPGTTAPATARVLSLPADRAPRLNLPLLRAGRLPDPDRPDEAALAEPFALANGLMPGDTLRITLNGQRRTLTVAGHVLSPEFVYTIGPGALMPDDRHFGVIWMGQTALAAAADLDGAFNDLVVGLARGASEPAVIAGIDRLLAPYGGTGAHGRDRQVSHAFLESEMQQLRAMTVILPPVFLIVSAFLVNMVLARLIALERSQIGLLKALGYGTPAIALHYVKMSVGIGLLGVALGWAGGWLAGQWMTALYTGYFRFPWLSYTPGAGPVALSGLLGVAAVLAGAVRAAWRAASLPPAEAMTPPAPAAFSRGLADSIGHRLHLRQTTMMILRSVTRWPGRAAVTVFGVSASVAVLVAAFSIFDAMDGLMDELFTHSNRQTVTLSLTDPRPDIAVTEALNLPGVRLAEGALALPVRLVHGASTRLTVLQARGRDASLTRLLDDDGRRIDLPAAGLVLPERLADALGVAPGDRIDIELLAPPRETWTVPVAAVVRQTIGQDAIMDRDAVARLMRQAPRVNQLDLLLDTAAIPALHARVKETPAIGGLALWSEVRAQFEATIRENIVAMTVIHSLLGALIAIGVVYNAARIQLSERAHELATLRVLGFSRGEVGFVLVGELMLLTALAVPVGWIAGWGFAALLVQGFSTDVVSLPLAVSRRTYAFATLVVVAAALGSALAVRRRLDRIDMVSALKAKV